MFHGVYLPCNQQLAEGVNRKEGSIPSTRSIFLSSSQARNYSGNQPLAGLLLALITRATTGHHGPGQAIKSHKMTKKAWMNVDGF
jgi:hypothetical protein